LIPKTPFQTCVLAVLALSLTPACALPLITEFMADNETTLADEDGIFSDWIEIHNPDATPVNLSGWTLTDKATIPAKWIFPAVTLEPGGFIVVFASGKNRTVPGAELHTNFSLAAGGEYLALLAPGGGIANQFSPEYPAQDTDRSYGLAFSGIPLVNEAAPIDYLIPSGGSLGSTWTQTTFSPTGWSGGKTGIGFGIQIPGFTVRQVKGSQTLDRLSRADSLLAGNNVLSDITVIRPVLNFLDTGDDGHFDNNQTFPGGGGSNIVIKGTATIIIPTAGAWTFGINSDDGGRIRIDGANVVVDDTNHGPQDHMGTVTLSAGQHSIDAMFFQGHGGAEMEIFAAPGTFTTFNSSMRLVGDTANGGLRALTTPDGSSGGGLVDTDVSAEMKNINSGAFIRIPFSADNIAGLDSLSLEMRYNDGFVAYLNGTRVASANAPGGTPVWNGAATATRDPTGAFTPEIFNLTSHISLLNPGANNILAIHGLNNTAADSSFLALPVLKGGGLLAGTSYFFDTPTPGAINGEPSSLGKVADTKFLPDRGFYGSPFSVAITSLTPGAEIRYTTDGSKPTATTGTVYTGSIPVTKTTVIRAAAFKFGFDPTDVDTQSYIFTSSVIQQSSTAPPGWPTGPVNGQVYSNYNMEPSVVNNPSAAIGGVNRTTEALLALPSLSISLKQEDLTGSSGIYSNPGGDGLEWEREASIELIRPPGYIDPDGNTEGFSSPCGLRIRGGFSRSTSNPKHSFRLFFRSAYGNGRLNYKLFGDEGADNFDKIDLRTPQNYSWAWGNQDQNSFIRDTWSRDLQGEMGNPYKRGRWYHLYLNGIYWGLYQTDERAEANYGETYLGGNEEDYDVVKSFGAVTDGDNASYRRLYEKWQAGFTTNTAYYSAQGKNPDGSPNPSLEKLLDVKNLVDYMIITYYTGDRDGPGSRFTQPTPNNYYGVFNRTNPDGYKFFEHDSEHSLGTGDVNMVQPFTSSSTFEQFNPHTLHERLARDNAEYRMAFADRIAELCYNGGLLTDAKGIARVDRRAAQLDTAIIAHSARWGNGTTRNRPDWLGAVQNVRNFITGRVPVMVGQVRAVGWYPSINPPVFSQHGGSAPAGRAIIISSPNPGTIYYTLDGNDPRQPGGNLNPDAQVFTSATTTVSLVPQGAVWKYQDNGSNQGTAWKESAFNDSSWPSGPARLGYGDTQATTTGFGPNVNARYPTTYFRRTFTATDIASIQSLTLELQRDDGAVVWLNGVEIGRQNMPAGGIGYQTYASASTGGIDETTFFPMPISPSSLREGSNTLCVEIHQNSASSSDLGFDLRLTGERASTAIPPTLSQPGIHTLRSRVFGNGQWSALNAATFVVASDPAAASNLVISEFHYNPAAPTAAEQAAGITDAGDFEFIELSNIGPNHLDLAGIAFTQGITFAFAESNPRRILAPGARVILVDTAVAFEARYGTGLPIAGSFSGNLSNEGERLVLLNAGLGTIRDFTYGTAAPWPDAASANGSSLNLVSPTSNPDHSLAASWHFSASPGGTPGAPEVSGYGLWKTMNGFPGDLSDDDRDGIPALLEYAMGGNPNSPSLLPTGEIMSLDVAGMTADYLVIAIIRKIGTTEVVLTAQTSTAISAWDDNPVLLTTTPNGDGTETLRFRSATPFSENPRQFIRAKAVLR